MKHWILFANHHITDAHIPPEGDVGVYEILANYNLKKGDTVYLWWNPHTCFYGWGEVAETPKEIVVEAPRPGTNEVEKKKRMSVTVNRKKGFANFITDQMMRNDRNLKDFVPTSQEDLCVIPLRPGQANALNDFIRQQGETSPSGSSTLVTYTHEPQLIKTLGDFSEKEKQILSYHYVDRLSINEIAGFWNLPVETVEEHLEIAIRKLLSFKESSYLAMVRTETMRQSPHKF